MTKTSQEIVCPQGVEHLSSHPLGKDFTVNQFKFQNGLQLLTLEDKSVPIITYQTWVNVGSRDEHPGITGIAHLFEHMMFKETKNYPSGHYDTVIETQGGQMNAGTSKDWTYYYANLPSDNLDLIAELESDRFQNLVLNHEQITTEREVVKEEKEFRYKNNIDGKMYLETYANAYKDHSYRWPVIGYDEDIAAISTDDCEKFYGTYYAPNNAILIIAGDIDTHTVLDTVMKYYGDMPSADLSSVTQTKAEPEQRGERRKVLIDKSIVNEKISIAYHGTRATDHDRIALEVANALLVDGKSSRLYQRLIHKEKVTSSVSGQIDTYKDPGLCRFGCTVANKRRAEDAEKIIYEEIDRIRSGDISQEELEKTKNNVEASFLRILKTNHYKGFMLGFHHLVHGDYREMFKEVQGFEQITIEDVKAAAEKYFAPDNRTVIIGRPQT